MKKIKGLLFLLLGAAAAMPAMAKEYLITAGHPNRLVLVDVAARKVERTYTIPGAGVPGIVSVPKDGKVAYVVTNRYESVSGIDLDTGKEVFRADMSEPGMRVKTMFSMAVSLDGKELYVHQVPVKVGRSEYEVQDTRIAVYDTADGLKAKPRRTFAAPRRIAGLTPGATRDRLYGLGWDLYAFDTRNGAIVNTFPVRNWQRPNYGEPDVLSIWNQYEQSMTVALPYYAPRTDVKPDAPEAMKTGIMTFNLETEKFEARDFENAQVVIFSAVVNPARKNEIFTVFNQLSKIDLDAQKTVARIDLPHSYYSVNISADGKEVYAAGATDKVAVYDTATLKQLAVIDLGPGDQGLASARMIQR